MITRVIREPSRDGATLGVVMVNERFFGFSCEDVIRELPGVPVEQWKVPAATAIPAGRYPIRVTLSNRFKRETPEVLNVPGFTGIRVHAGNTSADTEGCFLFGRQREDAPTPRVLLSKPACEAFQTALVRALAAGETCELVVENPPA